MSKKYSENQYNLLNAFAEADKEREEKELEAWRKKARELTEKEDELYGKDKPYEDLCSMHNPENISKWEDEKRKKNTLKESERKESLSPEEKAQREARQREYLARKNWDQNQGRGKK
jgi:hypothetical protein